MSEPDDDTERESALDPDLAARLGALPRELEPGRDLWPEVESRLASPIAGPTEPARVIRLWPALAVGLAAAAGLALWWAPTGEAGSPDPIADADAVRPAPEQATPVIVPVPGAPAPGEAPADGTMLVPGEEDYRSASAVLAQAIEDRRDELPGELASVYEDNVSLVDQAIASSRAALASDPEDEQLRALLDDAYRRKLDLLQQVAAIPGRT